MQFILIAIVLLAFVAIAPRFLKALLALDLAAIVLGYLGLRIFALLFGAGRGGRNAGMLQDESMILAVLMMAAPAIIVAGILWGMMAALLGQNQSSD